MSYCSRVYRQRNAHTHDETVRESFFSRKTSTGTPDSKASFFQAKLSINHPEDSYEKEADKVANAIVSHNAPTGQQAVTGTIQKQTTDPEKKKKRRFKKWICLCRRRKRKK